jgi:hypothetical protein
LSHVCHNSSGPSGEEAEVEKRDGELWKVGDDNVDDLNGGDVFAPCYQLFRVGRLEVLGMIADSSMFDGA